MPTRSRGGRGGYEPKARVLTRRARAWELSIRGVPQREIARELGVSQAAVSKMVDRVGRDFMRELQRRSNAYLARQVAQVDAYHREVTEAWEKSKSDQTSHGMALCTA